MMLPGEAKPTWKPENGGTGIALCYLDKRWVDAIASIVYRSGVACVLKTNKGDIEFRGELRKYFVGAVLQAYIELARRERLAAIARHKKRRSPRNAKKTHPKPAL